MIGSLYQTSVIGLSLGLPEIVILVALFGVVVAVVVVLINVNKSKKN